METMNEKLVHLEFMKAALTGLCSIHMGNLADKMYEIPSEELVTERALKTADAALIAYQKRWEGK